ncbi:restriction endonuclease subunit S [Sulfurimonas sp.]|uniref:restriction endonuclease subunit S n=1 Tax=Sulfurimonas sp. TaxID=2022749 RepID=UPI0019DC37EB|nr:restriction endonuclease subunit S [Sulfurimonas sp.]MBE0515302.1 restriction endonuclease subunit S [Sulfurimonas sp.]
MSELYELPDGWEWIEFSKVFNTPTSKPYQIQKTEYLENGLLPIIDQGKEFIIGYTNSIEKKYSNESNCIIFGDHTRQIKYVDFDFVIGADGTKILKEKDKNKYDLKFLYFQFLSKKIESLGYSRHFKLVKQMFFAIPPLQEQQRIVSKLDLLFEKIDRSIALHQKNMDEANAFMGSVLNDVFRELEEKYSTKSFDDVSLNIRYGYTDSAKDKGNAVFIRITDINENGKFKDNFVYVNIEDKELNRFKLSKGDILVARSGATAGKVALFDLDFVSVFASYLIRIQPSDDMNSTFLFYFCHSPKYWTQLNTIKVGGAQPNVNATNLKEIKIATPPLQIQQKVVAYLDDISQKIEKIKQLQKEKMASLKALKASILDSAFRGEL